MNKTKIAVIGGVIAALLLLAIYTNSTSKSKKQPGDPSIPTLSDQPTSTTPKKRKEYKSTYETLDQTEDYKKGGKHDDNSIFGGRYRHFLLQTEPGKNEKLWGDKLNGFEQLNISKQVEKNSFFQDTITSTDKLSSIRAICKEKYLQPMSEAEEHELLGEEIWEMCSNYYKRPQHISETLNSYYVGMKDNLNPGGKGHGKIGEIYKDHLLSPAYVNDLYGRVQDHVFLDGLLEIEKNKYPYFYKKQEQEVPQSQACFSVYELDKLPNTSTQEIPSEEELLKFCTLTGKKRKV